MKAIKLILLFVFCTLMNSQAQQFSVVKNVVFSEIWPHLTPSGNNLYFVAVDSTHGTELWKTDGTTNGTNMVLDIIDGPTSSNPTNLTDVNGTLFFIADDGIHGSELWKSDGTPSGTVMVRDLYPGISSSAIEGMTSNGTKLFFRATTISNGAEICVSDGTYDGTTIVKDINPGFSSSNPRLFINLNGIICFTANEKVNGNELWRTDGTDSGTYLLKDIYPGQKFSNILTLNKSGNNIFFAADDSIHGKELWKSDGTQSGTKLVKDIHNFNTLGSNPIPLGDLNGMFIFVAQDSGNVHGRELWKTDGTAENTQLIKDVEPGSADFRVFGNACVSGSRLYFIAGYSQTGGTWVIFNTDGTSNGTQMVPNHYYGNQLSAWSYLVNYQNALYFTALDTKKGYQLWKTEENKSTISLIGNIGSQSQILTPYYSTVFKNSIFFWGLSDGNNALCKYNSGFNGIVESNTLATNKIQVYPNPSAGLTTLVNNNTETVSVKIVDMNGKQIEAFSLPAQSKQTIDLSGRPSGIYLLQIIGSKEVMYKRLLINGN